MSQSHAWKVRCTVMTKQPGKESAKAGVLTVCLKFVLSE